MHTAASYFVVFFTTGSVHWNSW